MDKTKFISDFKSKLGIEPKNSTPQQIHNALGEVVMEMLADNWNDSRKNTSPQDVPVTSQWNFS